MNNWAKPELIDSWDNTGFQIGDENENINKLLIALDLDRKVLDKAIKEDFQMIITHHPIIFKPLTQILSSDHNENLIIDLIKNNIVAFNAHSNLDLSHNGVSHQLAKLLDIRNTEPLNIVYNLNGTNFGYGQVGEVENLSTIELINKIKMDLKVDHVLLYGRIEDNINRVAVCGGSGSDFIVDAYNKGAQVYITGDIKYHDAQLADELGISLIDAGHYHTEKVILPKIKDYLDGIFKDKIIIELVYESNLPFKIL